MAGYSPNPLVKKLGYKDGQVALLITVPPRLTEISQFTGFAKVTTVETPHTKSGPRDTDVVHWFETSRARLTDHLPAIAAQLRADGMLWISWPKKSSKVPTDITEDVLREVILPTGLVDVKVCAVDEVWSGLKFMWRKEVRAGLS
jgi:hypothetical protein